MNLRIVIIVNIQGIETIRIVSSPDEEAVAEALLLKIRDELEALDAKVKHQGSSDLFPTEETPDGK